MSEIHTPVRPVVLVVAPPGYYRNSLVALLGTIPGSQKIVATADLLQAEAHPDAIRPDTVLLAASPHLPSTGTLAVMVERMRRWWPLARFVLLADAAAADSSLQRLADYRLRYNASAGDLSELFGRFPVVNKAAPPRTQPAAQPADPVSIRALPPV
jgi:hypothetical protein